MSKAVRLSVGWSVGLPVIIFKKGGKLHFRSPIGAIEWLRGMEKIQIPKTVTVSFFSLINISE